MKKLIAIAAILASMNTTAADYSELNETCSSWLLDSGAFDKGMTDEQVGMIILKPFVMLRPDIINELLSAPESEQHDYGYKLGQHFMLECMKSGVSLGAAATAAARKMERPI